MVHDTLALGPRKSGWWKRRSRNGAPVLQATTENDTITNVRGAVVLMLIGVLILLTFDSEGLRHISRDLPANKLADAAISAADRWHALMLQAGPAHVAPGVHAAFEKLRGISW